MTSGVLINPDVKHVGGTLSAAVPAGSLVLPVYDAGDFEEEFSTGDFYLTIGEDLTPRRYVAVENDEDAQQSIELAFPTTVAYEAGLPVTMWDPLSEADDKRAVQYLAEVRLSDRDPEDELVPVLVRHTLVPLSGVYSLEGAQVTLVEDEDGQWWVDNVDGRAPVVDPGTLDRPKLTEIILEDAPEGGGIVTDGLAPASTPTPTVRGAVKSVAVTLPEVDNADPVTVDLWASLTSPVSTSGPPLLSVTAPGQSIQFLRQVGGVDLDPTTTVYIKTRARDDDGPGPFSVEASGTPALINSEDIVADFITTNMLIANEALIDALQVVDLSALTFTSPLINGGSIYIAQGVAANLTENFAGTSLPSGWSSARTGPDGVGAAGAGVPGASVVSTGPAGQVGSALLFTYAASGADNALAANQAAGEVTTSLPATANVEFRARFRLALDMAFLDGDFLYLAARSSDGAAFSSTWDGITLSLLPEDTINGFRNYPVISWTNGIPSELGRLSVLTDPSAAHHVAKLRVAGGQVQAKVWRDGDAEPKWTTFAQSAISAVGRASIAWRAIRTLSTVSRGQKAWVDSFTAASFVTGLEVNPNGDGDWKPVLDPIRTRVTNLESASAQAGSDIVPVTAVDVTFSKRVDYSPAFPAGVVPVPVVNSIGTFPERISAMSTDGHENTGFTVYVRRSVGTANTGFTWVAMPPT